MHPTRPRAPWRAKLALPRPIAVCFAVFAVLAVPACSDANRPVALEPKPLALADVPSTRQTGAVATYTATASTQTGAAKLGRAVASAVANLNVGPAADPANIVRIYKDHDAWRSVSDGGRDEMTLVRMGKVKGTDFFVHPMSELASGIPSGTRVVLITANSTGDPTTSERQRAAEAQAALVTFLGTGGTLLVDLADNDSAEGFRVPGVEGTPGYDVPPSPDCADATLSPVALGDDGLRGTLDDHRIVRGPDGVAATTDDLDDEKVDLARGGSDVGGDRSADPSTAARGCSVVHGSLRDGLTLPSNARVLATATWPDGQRPVLAEYCHAGGRVVINTFTLGYFGQKPREGLAEPVRSSYLQASLLAYALSPESGGCGPPVITAPATIEVTTDAGSCSAADVAVGAPQVSSEHARVALEGLRADAEPLVAPYPRGATLITWTATDEEGQTSTATQHVVVSDVEKPIVTAPAHKAAPTDPSGRTARVDVGVASATDNCSDAPTTVTATRSDGVATLDAPYKVGTTTITWTARDGSGNETTADQTIVVSDPEPPTLDVPTNFTVDATIPGGSIVKFYVWARDNVEVTSVSCSSKSGPIGPQRPYTPHVDSRGPLPIGLSDVTCTAADAAGNSVARTFTVTVRGPAGQIKKVIEYVQAAMLPSPPGAELLDILNRVLADVRNPAAACPGLDAFTTNVSANAGTLIPADKATAMTADARRIKDVLACSSHVPTGQLVGTVRVSATLQHVHGATVTVSGGPVAGFSKSVTSDVLGFYEIVGLSPGTYTVTASAVGFIASQPQTVKVAGTFATTVAAAHFTLRAEDHPATLLVRVLGSSVASTHGVSMQTWVRSYFEVAPRTPVGWRLQHVGPIDRPAWFFATGALLHHIGNDDIRVAHEVVLTATAVNGSGKVRINSFSFDHYPRLVTLVWRKVWNAKTYHVTVETGTGPEPGCGGVPANCTTWNKHHATSFVVQATDLDPCCNQIPPQSWARDFYTGGQSHTIQFPGRQPGRWRVVAKDAAGNVIARDFWGNVISPSEYVYFNFIR